MTLFIFNMYQSVLLQIMTSKRVVVPFKNTIELARLIAAGEKYLLAYTSSSSYNYQVQHSPLPAFQIMKAALNQNALVIERNNTLLGNSLSLDPRAAAPMYPSEALNHMGVHCNLIYQIDHTLLLDHFRSFFERIILF